MLKFGTIGYRRPRELEAELSRPRRTEKTRTLVEIWTVNESSQENKSWWASVLETLLVIIQLRT